jgi:nitrogen fixation NifU-like protein
MANLTELYQEVIIDHNRAPRNFKRLADANRVAQGDNPLCGDHIDLFLKVEGDRIADIGFQGSGCAIAQASASLMTSAVQGKSVAEAEQLFTAFHDLVTGVRAVDKATLGKLMALSGVRQFPMRVKCASLSWHALRAALHGDKAATTEDPAK